jgi:hypothetical protein
MNSQVQPNQTRDKETDNKQRVGGRRSEERSDRDRLRAGGPPWHAPSSSPGAGNRLLPAPARPPPLCSSPQQKVTAKQLMASSERQTRQEDKSGAARRGQVRATATGKGRKEGSEAGVGAVTRATGTRQGKESNCRSSGSMTRGSGRSAGREWLGRCQRTSRRGVRGDGSYGFKRFRV